MERLLPTIHASASTYRAWTEGGARPEGSLTPLELFAYRASAVESESVKPLVIWATDPGLEQLDEGNLRDFLASLESWLVRRALLRAPTKAYNKFFAELLAKLWASPRSEASTIVSIHLAKQDSVNTHWPSDDEVRTELRSLPIYRRLRRGRLRMVLEALEDYERGFGTADPAYADGRVRRGSCAIEHLLPQRWETHWPVGDDPHAISDRNASVHLLGNVTLLTGRLNSKVSNGPWLGETGKRAALEQRDVLLLNRYVREKGADGWNEARIATRTEKLISDLLKVWPAPEGHLGLPQHEAVVTFSVSLADLVSEGLLVAGQTLFGHGKYSSARATVLADGTLQVGEQVFQTPSGAGKEIRGRATNGWGFWRTEAKGDASLRDLRIEYSDHVGVNATSEDDEGTDD